MYLPYHIVAFLTERLKMSLHSRWKQRVKIWGSSRISRFGHSSVPLLKISQLKVLSDFDTRWIRNSSATWYSQLKFQNFEKIILSFSVRKATICNICNAPKKNSYVCSEIEAGIYVVHHCSFLCCDECEMTHWNYKLWSQTWTAATEYRLGHLTRMMKSRTNTGILNPSMLFIESSQS